MKRRRHKHHNGCRGKARYGTFAEASTEQPSQHPYPCVHCGCWHLTSNELPRGAR